MSETIYPKGIRVFPPHANAPAFVKGTVIITLNEIIQFCKENPNLLTEYREQKQLKCQLLSNDDGELRMTVDTWKPDGNAREEQPEVNGNFDPEPLPF